MKTRISRFIAALLIALSIMGLAQTAAIAGPKAGTSPAPAANKEATKSASTKIEGTITQYSKEKITVRADGKDWELMLNGKKTATFGKPEVDKQAKVWFKTDDKGNKVASRIDVAKADKGTASPAATPKKK
ncbi:MAG: hypothetical protein EB084_17290 [Proteobacteria bacterium]|nr:hypothetical protein [Pseudomonadota bacterium]